MLNVKVNWKDIEGFEGYAQVSNTGLVRSIRTNHGKYQERLLKTYFRSGCLYPMVQITKNNISHKFMLHRLVAKAFVANPESKPEVNHIDGDKLNNNAYNLEWVTRSENLKHAHRTGLKNPVKARLGEKSGITSKYHNVCWDKSRLKWKAIIKKDGKPVFQKRFDNEVDAAKAVDNFLIENNISDRSLNFS